MDALHVPYVEFIVPDKANLIPAYGTALSAEDAPSTSLQKLRDRIASAPKDAVRVTDTVPPIFHDEKEYADWKKEKEADQIILSPLTKDTDKVFVGIDSGSTTTKLVVTDENDRILYTHYGPNNGNPVGAVREAFAEFFIQNAWPLGPIPASWEAALQAMAKTLSRQPSASTRASSKPLPTIWQPRNQRQGFLHPRYWRSGHESHLCRSRRTEPHGAE